jgi:hypothetical protein
MSMDEPYCHEQLWAAGNYFSADGRQTDLVVPRIHKVTIRDNFGCMRYYFVFIEDRDKVVA